MWNSSPELEWAYFCNADNPAASRTVCHLPADLRTALEARTSAVRIRRDYALKATQKHGLTASHLALMPDAILTGAVYQEAAGQLAFFFGYPRIFRNHLFLVVKSIHSGREIWVKSFHWKSDVEKRRLVKRMHLIRPEDN